MKPRPGAASACAEPIRSAPPRSDTPSCKKLRLPPGSIAHGPWSASDPSLPRGLPPIAGCAHDARAAPFPMQMPRSNSGPAGAAAPHATPASHPAGPPSTSLVSSPLVYTPGSSFAHDRWPRLSVAGSPPGGAVSEHPKFPTYRAPCMPIRPPCFQETRTAELSLKGVG